MIEKVVNKLREEPVRARVYALAVAVLSYLATKGVLTPEDVAFYVTVAGIVLAVESSRSKVEPLHKQRK